MLGDLRDRLGPLGATVRRERFDRHQGMSHVLSAWQISASAAFARGCADFDRAARTFELTWNQHRCSRASGNISCKAFQNPSAPSPTAKTVAGVVRWGGRARWTRRCSTMRAPPKTRSPSSQCACFGEQTAAASGSSAYTSRTALLTKRRAVRSISHLVTKRAWWRGEMWPRRQERVSRLKQAHRAVPS